VLLMDFLERPTRALFFTGKGGMGKTSIACAVAVSLARRGLRVLVVSTDPASNLDEVLETPLGQTPTPVTGEERLFALNLDPEEAARDYRERIVGPYRGVLPESAVASIEEQLSGACTLEIAAFDEFARLLGDPRATSDFDHVVFDTAPTGHTLRLLGLSRAWSGFIADNTTGTSCLGPLAGLEAQRSLYEATVAALADPEQTTLVLVARPEPSALAEAERTRAELEALGVANQQLVLNGLFTATSDDPVALALELRQRDALADFPPKLAELDRSEIPLLPFAPLGLDNLAHVFDQTIDNASEISDWPEIRTLPELAAPLEELVDEIAQAGRGVILTMGKGGVGKTTIAAAIATELTRRGHPVHLSTTDPAAHLAQTVDAYTDGLTVSRIDPEAEIRAYTEEVLATAGAGLDPEGRALLEEDLRSPCTEEIAVFRAFARTVAAAEDGFVVLDTAPTGHTLLLLEAAEAYDRDVARTSGQTSEEIRELLPRLRDPDYARVLLITLPEATPVHEAVRLADDLARAGIHPYAWVVNQSLAPTRPSDSLLAERARRELPYIQEARNHAGRFALVPWQQQHPIGGERLAALLKAS
jgi:arsenite/tail-anchored protein-transporting ATPase